jgi:transposase
MYSPDKGRPVVNFPEMMFRADLIQFLYKLSDRQLANAVNENIVYTWFIGYDIYDNTFHWTSPGKFRIVIGKDKHKEIFDRIIDQLIDKGLIGKNENQSIDATHIIGNIAIPTTIGIIKQAVKQALLTIQRRANTLMPKIKEEIDIESYIRYKGKKEYKMTDEEKHCTLNQVITDAQKVIWTIELALEIGELTLKPKHEKQLKDVVATIKKILGDYIKDTPYNGNDGSEGSNDFGPIKRKKPKIKKKYAKRKSKGKDRLVSTVDKDVRWGAKTEEKIFAGYKAHSTMTDNGFVTNIEVTRGNVSDDSMAERMTKHQKERHGLKPNKMRGDGIYGTINNRKAFNGMGIQLVAPENTSHNKGQFPRNKFKLDIENNSLTCPAEKVTTKYYTKENTKNISYYFSVFQCRPCHLKKQCTKSLFRSVFFHEDFTIQEEAIKYNKTEEYKEDMKMRSHIEPKQAEMKRFHGLTRAIYRGLERVNIQAIYTAIVVNLKRMVKVMSSDSYRSKVFG